MITDHRCRANDLGDMIWYENAMISSFPGVFDDCEDNYDVEDKLRKAKVINGKNRTDTESCALVINFSNSKSAEAFGKRLELYIHANTPSVVN